MDERLKTWIFGFLLLVIICAAITIHRDETKIQNRIFELVNEEREKVGISALVYDASLSKVAKEHSDRMIEEHFLGHRDIGIGENVFECPVWYWTSGCGLTITNNQIAECMVEGWKKSPGHYSNMISFQYTRTGIGVSCNLFECKENQN